MTLGPPPGQIAWSKQHVPAPGSQAMLSPFAQSRLVMHSPPIAAHAADPDGEIVTDTSPSAASGDSLFASLLAPPTCPEALVPPVLVPPGPRPPLPVVPGVLPELALHEARAKLARMGSRKATRSEGLLVMMVPRLSMQRPYRAETAAFAGHNAATTWIRRLPRQVCRGAVALNAHTPTGSTGITVHARWGQVTGIEDRPIRSHIGGRVELGGLDHGRRVVARVGDAPGQLARHFAVEAHRADENQPTEAARMHRCDDGRGLWTRPGGAPLIMKTAKKIYESDDRGVVYVDVPVGRSAQRVEVLIVWTALPPDDDVVHRREHRRGRLVAKLAHDREQRLAELCERLLRLPHIEDLEVVAAPEARVVEPALGHSRPGLDEAIHHLGIQLHREIRLGEVHAYGHG